VLQTRAALILDQAVIPRRRLVEQERAEERRLLQRMYRLRQLLFVALRHGSTMALRELLQGLGHRLIKQERSGELNDVLTELVVRESIVARQLA
jgi:hypothetical protein